MQCVQVLYSLRIDGKLTAVGLGAIVIDFLVSQMISQKHANVSRLQMRDESRMDAATVAGIEMMETIKASGPRILVLDGGKIAEEGTYSELLSKNGLFAALVKRQQLDLTARQPGFCFCPPPPFTAQESPSTTIY